MSQEEVLKKFADPDALRKVSELWERGKISDKKNIYLNQFNQKSKN
jgi:hypothetical protein